MHEINNQFVTSPNNRRKVQTMKRLNELKILETLISVKLDKTKTARAASRMMLFGLSGWFLWHAFLVESENMLPSILPQASAAVRHAPAMQPLTSVRKPIETSENLTVTEPKELTDKLLVPPKAQQVIKHPDENREVLRALLKLMVLNQISPRRARN